MGQAFRKLFDAFFGNFEMRVCKNESPALLVGRLSVPSFHISKKYLEGFEKLEQRKRDLFKRAYDLEKETGEIVSSFISTMLIFYGILGSGGLYMGLTCQDAQVIPGEIVIVFVCAISLVYGAALWRLRRISVDSDDLVREETDLLVAVEDYIAQPEGGNRDFNDEILVERLLICSIGLTCLVHCKGFSAPPPPSFHPLVPPPPPISQSLPPPPPLQSFLPPPQWQPLIRRGPYQFPMMEWYPIPVAAV